MASFVKWGVVAVLAAMTVGCGGDPTGNWQSRDELPNGKRTKLFVEEGGGELKMYVQISKQAGLVRLKYDVDEWFVEADGAYEFSLICKENCDIPMGVNVKLDFEMDCIYETSNEWLDCEAKSPWKGYGFLDFEAEPGE
jgi:hypothetical protein